MSKAADDWRYREKERLVVQVLKEAIKVNKLASGRTIYFMPKERDSNDSKANG